MSIETQVDLIVAVKAQTEQLQKLIAEVSKLTGSIAATGKESEKAGSSFEKFIATAADIAVTGKGIQEVAGYLKDFVVTTFDMVKGIAEADLQLSNLANSTGASKESLKALDNEAVKIGKDFGEVRGAISQFAGFLNSALTDPASQAAQQAKDLGINLEEVGRSSNKIDTALKQVGASTNGVVSGLQQSSAAITAFGEDSFQFMIPALEGIDKKIGDVQKRGQILTPEQSKRAKELGSSLGDLKGILEGLTTTVLADTIPAINDLVTIGKDELAALLGDPEFVNGLKSGLESLSVLIKNFGADLIAVAGKAISLFGRVGETVSALLSPFETLNFLITGNATQTEKSAIANKEFDSAVKGASEAVIKLTADIKRLTEEQSINQKASEINSQKQLFIVSEQLRLGIIGQEEAAKRRAEIDAKDLERKTGDAFKQLSIIRDGIARQLGLQENAIKSAEKLEQESNSKRKTLLEQFEKDRIASEQRIAAASEELAQKKADRQKELNDTELSERKNRSSEIDGLNKADEASLQSLIQAERQNLETKRANIEILRGAEKKASTDRAEAEKSLSDLRAAINKKELEDGTTLSKELLDLRKKLFDAETLYSQLTLQQTQQRVKQIQDLEKGILGDRDKGIEKLISGEKEATNLLQQELAKREINRQQFEDKKLSLTIDTLSKEISQNESALQKLQSLEGASADQIREIKQKLTDDKLKLSELETDQKVKLAEKAASQEKALEERRNGETKRGIEDVLGKVRQGYEEQENAIRKILILELDANRQKLIAKQSEIDLARQSGASDEEQAKLKNELLDIQRLITKEEKALKGEANDVADSIRSQVSAAAEAGKAIGDITAATSQSVKSLYGQNTILANQFHDTGASLVSDVVEQGKAGIAALAQAEAAAVQAQRVYLQQAYNAIQAAYREAEQARVDANETANEQLLDAQKTYDEKIRKLREDFVKFHKDTERQIVENIFEGLKLIAEETSRNEANRTAIIKEESDRRKAIETSNANEIFNILQSLNEKLADQQEQAGKDAFAARSSFLDKIAALENEQSSAKTQKEKDEIQKRIDAANEEERQRLDREQRKKEALSALDAEFAEKSKGVTDPEELKRLQAEYEARKKNTEDKFSLEEDFQSEYDKLVASGNQKRADELKEAYEKEQKDLDDSLQKKLDNIAANYKHQQELAEAQRVAEETAYQKKLADEQTRHDAEVASIIQREAEKNQKLQEALDDEKRRRKNQREAIENEYRDSEKRIRETLQESLDKIQSKLSDALDAAVGRIKSFASSGSSAINGLSAAIDALIAKAQQAIGLTQKLAGGNSTGFPGSNLTSANTTNNVTSTGSSSPISNIFGNGFTSNVTTSPIDSSDKTGNDSASDSDTNKNKSKGKGPVKQANTNKVSPTSANNNLTDSPLSSDDQGDKDGGDSDSEGKGKNKNKGKGGVEQAGSVNNSDSTDSTENNVTSTDTQADTPDRSGKKGVKIKPQSNRGDKVSTTNKRDKGKGLDFDSGAESDDDSDSDTTDSSSGADKGNSNGGKAGGAKGDVIIDVGGVRVDVGVSLSLTLSALTGKNREEVINATIDRIIDQARSKSGKGAQIIVICRDDVFAVLDKELERQGIF